MSTSYRDLRVWQQAMDLTVQVYELTEKFPKHETYGLMSQLRRAAVSVPSNIAEGKGRNTDRDFVHFLYQARGSLLEVETQIQLSQRLGYLNEQQAALLLKSCAVVGSSLTGLINSLKEATAAGTGY